MADRTSRIPTDPRVDRHEIPADGVTRATRFVEWRHVEDRLRKERVYWLAAGHRLDGHHGRSDAVSLRP
jgi:hypothetical protein